MSTTKGQLAQPIFSKIAPHEFLVAKLVRPSADQEYEIEKIDHNKTIAAAASLGTRPNGRTPSESRPFDVHIGALSQAHGSATVRLGQTRVICGVRGEILPVASIPQYRPSIINTAPTVSIDDSTAAFLPATSTLSAAEADNRRQLRDYDLLVPNLELNTGSAPEFLPGGPPSVLAQTLSTRLYDLLHSSGLVDAEQLKIWQRQPAVQPSDDAQMALDDDASDDDGTTQTQSPEIKAYWTLYIDLLFLSFDGNPFDAAWAAVVAALRNTRLPLAQWDADRDLAVCSSLPKPPLRLRGLPVATTAVLCVENKRKQQLQSSRAAGAHWILIDPDRLEESQCREAATVVLDCSTGSAMVQALSKSGGIILGPSQIRQLSAYAEKRWAEFSIALERQT